MTQVINLGWSSHDVDIALTEEVVALAFDTPDPLPTRGIMSINCFEIGGSPPHLMRCSFSTEEGNMDGKGGFIASMSGTAAGVALPCADQPAHKPGKPPHKTPLEPGKRYFANLQLLDHSQPVFQTRVTMRVPKGS